MAGKDFFDSIGSTIGSAFAVPKDIVTGDFGKLPGDIFNNAVAGVSNVLLPGAGASLGIGNLGGQLLGSAVGGLGSSIGSSLFGGGSHDNSPPTPSPYVPKQDAAMGLPASLSQFGGLSPEQQSTNLATQGVYGGGEGPEENKYFLNLINRRLVDQTGKVGSTDSVNPVENSFLSTLGLGGYKDTNDLLTKIHGYQG